MKTLLTVIGLVMILEGVPYFTMPAKVKEVALMITETDSTALRFIGFALMAGGLLMVAAIRLWLYPEP